MGKYDLQLICASRIRMGKNRISVNLTITWLLVPDRLLFLFLRLLVSWDYYADQSLEFTKNDTKNKKTSTEWQFCRQKCLFDEKGQRKMARQVKAERKAMVPEITSLHNCGEQKNISACSRHQTMRQMGYISTNHVGFLSSQPRTEIWCCSGQNSPKLDSWRLKNVTCNMDATAYLNIAADHLHSFMATIYPSSNGYLKHDNALCQKAKFISNMTMSSMYLKCLPSHQHLWDVAELEISTMNVRVKHLEKNCDALANFSYILWSPCNEKLTLI